MEQGVGKMTSFEQKSTYEVYGACVDNIKSEVLKESKNLWKVFENKIRLNENKIRLSEWF